MDGTRAAAAASGRLGADAEERQAAPAYGEPGPLRRGDPPGVGDIQLTGRLGQHDAGIVYDGSRDGERVVVVLLTAGAENDSYARARFGESLDSLQVEWPGTVVARETDPEVAPWAALAVEGARDTEDTGAPAGHHHGGEQAARRLLTAVSLEDRPPVGRVDGPQFRPHWYRRDGAGRWRLWPLPWPVRLSSAGRWTFVASFLLVLAIATLALWIAVQIFRDQAPPPPGPGPGPGPVPPPTSPSPTPTPTPPTSPGPQPTPTGPTGTGSPAPPIV